MTANLRAADIMRRRLITLRPQTPVIQGTSRLLRENISGAPVVDASGNHLGVFSEKCSLTVLTDAIRAAQSIGLHVVRVTEFMTRDLIVLSPDRNVFDAIDHLLGKRISGAPVVDDRGRFLGVFSEKTAMRVLVAAIHDGLPGTEVSPYMNLDRGRVIDPNDLLLSVAEKFLATPFRRLPVLTAERLVGQVSRRDVLKAEHRLAIEVAAREESNPTPGDTPVADAMDVAAPIGNPDMDLLSMAQLFLSSPYRRLPILDEGKLVGQVSRRDLLAAAADGLRPSSPRRRAEPLYFSLVGEGLPPRLG